MVQFRKTSSYLIESFAWWQVDEANLRSNEALHLFAIAFF